MADSNVTILRRLTGDDLIRCHRCGAACRFNPAYLLRDGSGVWRGHCGCCWFDWYYHWQEAERLAQKRERENQAAASRIAAKLRRKARWEAHQALLKAQAEAKAARLAGRKR